MIKKKLSFDTFVLSGGVSNPNPLPLSPPKKKSGKKSENTDTGCLEHWQKYF